MRLYTQRPQTPTVVRTSGKGSHVDSLAADTEDVGSCAPRVSCPGQREMGTRGHIQAEDPGPEVLTCSVASPPQPLPTSLVCK